MVLAPTNKACDVITTKLLDNNKGKDDTWIWRFVATGDIRIEEEEVVYTRDSMFGKCRKVCVISTIARFPYDGFETAKLNAIEWDYVIIDEASMIPLAQIIYPIYKCEKAEIIIAGDPFQIEPIVYEDSWKDENIYSMVNLNSFKSPRTEPIQYTVKNLSKQYRSIPSIGELFNQYTYDKLLSHHRSNDSRRILKLDNLKFNSINFVTFPIIRGNSIFESKKISSSNIHLYSVLTIHEFMLYLGNQISKNHPDETFKIGIISPYKAQSEMISKLWEQRTEYFNNIEVFIGTVHGFQGDECDIIIAAYNTPEFGMIRSYDKTFVNKKNILNVAISRAKDYLFVFMPNSDSREYENLIELRRLGKIALQEKSSLEVLTAEKLEKVIFGQSNFIENNTFITTHQLANVYSNPTVKYEIRIDENTIDIQYNPSSH